MNMMAVQTAYIIFGNFHAQKSILAKFFAKSISPAYIILYIFYAQVNFKMCLCLFVCTVSFFEFPENCRMSQAEALNVPFIKSGLQRFRLLAKLTNLQPIHFINESSILQHMLSIALHLHKYSTSTQ
jgi:hypothetical protein